MRLTFETDKGAETALGLIVLSTDETLETEIRALIPPTVALHHSRVAAALDVSADSLAAMAAELPRAAALLPRRPFDVVGYGCTSGATIIGSDRVARIVRASHPDAAVVDPLSAAIDAFRALDVRRIGFVTPYVEDVSAAMRGALQASGLTVAAFGSFEQAEEAVVARITEASLLEAICDVGAVAGVEAVFASCTNLRGLGIVETAERRLGKPVFTSNLALTWAMLKSARVAPTGGGIGRLFSVE